MQNIILQNLQEPLLLRRFQHSIQIIRCKIQDIPGIEIRGQTLHIMRLVGFDQDNVSRIQHMTDTIQEANGRFYVVATAIVSDTEGLHTIQATACAREAEAKKGMDDSQITGTASSYARKYALNGLFCLDDVTDADSAKQEAEDELFAIIPCADCKYNILPHNDGKRSYTPPQIAAMTKKAFGRELCWKCAEKARDSGKKA